MHRYAQIFSICVAYCLREKLKEAQVPPSCFPLLSWLPWGLSLRVFFSVFCFALFRPRLVLKSLSFPSVYSISIFCVSSFFFIALSPLSEMPHMPPHMPLSSKRTHTHTHMHTHMHTHTYTHINTHTYPLPQTIHLDTNSLAQSLATSLSAPY